MARFAFTALLFLAFIAPLSGAEKSRANRAEGVTMTQTNDRVRVEINGQLFTEYHYKEGPHLFYFPVFGPGNADMTRHYPMENIAAEDHDHPHHRALWFSHGEVNGEDFWAETPKSGKIVHQKFTAIQSGKDAGWIKSENHWIARDGKIICTDETTFKVYNAGPERLVDFEIRLKADHGELKFGDTKEGSMAIRVAETMKVKGHAGENHILTSEGARDDDAWGKRAKWCDYSGTVQGKKSGVAIFDHPENPRHPTWWHVRDYGLFAANPFGQHDFEKKPPGTGDLTVPAGETLVFRYRFYFHEGEAGQARIEEHYQDYVAGRTRRTVQ